MTGTFPRRYGQRADAVSSSLRDCSFGRSVEVETMSRWSWRSSEGRTQAEQQAHQRNQRQRNAEADKAAKQRQERAQAKGRSIPQRGRER